MPLDAITIGGLATELDTKLKMCRIDKIYQPSKAELYFATRVGSKNTRLKISLSSKPYIYLTDEKQENPEKALMFCMLLRKHLTGAKILEVSSPKDERMITIKLESINEMGDIVERSLILELMGRNANLIMCDETGRIIDCVKRVDFEMSEERQLLPGLFYDIPPKSNKLSFSQISKEDFAKMLENANGVTADKWLLDNFVALSPLVCRELSYLACGDTEYPVDDMTAEQRENLADTAFGIINKNHNPYLLYKKGEKLPFDFSFMQIKQYGEIECVQCDGYSQMLSKFFDERQADERLTQIKNQLRKNMATLRDRLSRKIAEQREEIKNAQKRDILKKNADLIMANLSTIERGQTSVTVTDWFDENQPQLEIKLDIKLNAHQNAQKYYKNYTKFKNAENILTEKIAEGENELFYLESVLDEIARATSSDELAEIKEELQNGGYVKDERKRKKTVQFIAKPHKYCTSGGFTVYAGRNNKENEALTLKASSKSDIWFHVKNAPGSHVILVCDGKQPSDSDYTQAAIIAAYHSSVKNSSQVPVDYTTVKNVKKLHGGKTGMVNYYNFNTAFVSPDEQQIDGLKADK